MYRQGHRTRSHRKLYSWLIVGFIVVIVVGGIGAHHFLRANTHLSSSPPVTLEVKVPTVTTKRFTEPTFSIALPSDWKSRRVMQTPQPTYSWENTTGNVGVETLSVFVDTIPANLAINRVLAVQANSGSIVTASGVSDNCTTFTGTSITPTTPEDITAKWAGVNFLCDTANYERDVVGTSSPQGINTVTVTGPTKGTHAYFFTYTDNSDQPDYTIFTNALMSFKAK